MTFTRQLATAALVGVCLADALAAPVLPEHTQSWVHFSTTTHGGVIGDKYTQPEAVRAAKAGQPLPYGTVIYGIEYEDQNGVRGLVARYILMEKVKGGGREYPASVRNGEWEYASYTPDKRLITTDPVTRCLACHKSAAATEYLFGYDKLKTVTAEVQP